MTTGQRIAELRRQQNLSQEALGELLGVTRQSISKWESDAALPEVEKLVAMSRLFRISVGALLGVEEPAGEAEGAELTDAQLKMAEEIAGRYIAALSAPREAVPLPRRPSSRHNRSLNLFDQLRINRRITGKLPFHMPPPFFLPCYCISIIIQFGPFVNRQTHLFQMPQKQSLHRVFCPTLRLAADLFQPGPAREHDTVFRQNSGPAPHAT